jgi:hypothetical protein
MRDIVTFFGTRPDCLQVTVGHCHSDDSDGSHDSGDSASGDGGGSL